MVYVDSRVGSREVMRYLPVGVAQMTKLPFGDAMFLGNGKDDIPVHVGVEIKALGDMLKSIVDGRFAGHQLPGLLRDYHVVYLIIEGKYRPDPDTGLLQVPGPGHRWVEAEYGAKRWMHRDLDGFLTTMEMRYGIKTRRSFDRKESAQIIANLYHWWTDKTYEEHKSGCAFDYSGEPTLLPTSLLRRVAAQLKGIGWKRAQSVEQHFTSVVDMILAPTEEWMRIPGIGFKVARDVVEEIWRQKNVGIPAIPTRSDEVE